MRGGRAGVVDEHVEPPEASPRPRVIIARTPRLVAHVALHQQRLAPSFSAAATVARAAFALLVIDRDVVAGARQRQHGGAADAGGRAGDEGRSGGRQGKSALRSNEHVHVQVESSPCQAARRMSGAAQIVIDGVCHTYRPPRGRDGAGTRQGLARRRGTRVRGAAGAERLRQVDAALSNRRVPTDGAGRDPGRGRAGRRPGPGPRHRLPALRAVPVEDGARERPLRPGRSRACARGERERRARRTSTSSV